eukprot:6157593-Amphidinium_carterae.1
MQDRALRHAVQEMAADSKGGQHDHPIGYVASSDIVKMFALPPEILRGTECFFLVSLEAFLIS